MREGKGVFHFSKDSPTKSYDGLWKEDKRSGQGTLIWSEGSQYIGQFENNQTHGYGILANQNSLEKFEGMWKEGKRHGKGIQNYSTGATYVGRFENGLRHGQVTKHNTKYLSI